METFLLSSTNLPFTISVIIGSVLVLILLLSTFVGLDGFLGDVDHDFDVDLDHDYEFFDIVANWYGVGRIPISVIVVTTAMVFGSIGLAINYYLQSIFNFQMPALLGIPIAVAFTLPVNSIINRILAKLWPKDITNAIKVSDLVGHDARITVGVATTSRRTTANVVDIHGVSHQVFVKAYDEDLTQGSNIKLISYDNNANVFTAMKRES